MKKTLLIAHRGGGAGIFENKIGRIKETLEEDLVDAIEVDVRKTKDDVLVLNHSRGVSLNGQRVWIDKADYNQIKHLGIPTLEEVLPYFIQSDKILDLDIKEEDVTQPLKKLLKRYNFRKKMFISCVSLETLLELQENLPNGEYFLSLNPKDSRDLHRRFIVRMLGILITVFFSQLIIYFLKKRLNKRMKLDGLSIYHQFAKRSFINDLKKFGFKVFVWGSDRESKIKKLANLEVDGIKTRKLEILSQL